MATSLVVNGVSYLYPDTGDQSWGAVASAWAAAVTSGTLQKAGGAFTLTADANFGATFGLVSAYYKTTTANIASTGQIRLADADTISWRNHANGADIALSKNTSDQLVWNSNVILPQTTKGDLVGYTGSATARLPVGSDGQVLSAQSGQSTGLQWVSPLTNPMTTLGDMISGGAAGAATRLIGDTSNNRVFLREQASGGVATAPVWDSLVAGDIPSLNASKITAGTLATARGGTNMDSSASTGVAKVAAGAWSVAAAAASDFGTQTAGTFLAGPTSGSAATPTFRALQGPTIQSFTSGSGTYTTPAGVLYLIVEIVGGGGGGGCSGTTSGTAATNGADSTFSVHSGAAILTAAKGLLGARGAEGGAGGSATVAAGATKIVAVGGAAGGTANTGQGAVSSATPYVPGSYGGSSYFGGAGRCGGSSGTGAGGDAAANTGSGGGGGYLSAAVNSVVSGAGGGSGAYIRALVTTPSASYDYVVGAGGSGQLSGSNGSAGGAGGSGYLVVTEFYQ